MFRSTPLTKFMYAACLSGAIIGAHGCAVNAPGDDVPETRTLGVSFEGLEALGNDYVYEGWLIVGEMPVSTGRFRIDANGDPEPAEFAVQAADVDEATLFVLTIEPAVGDDPAPADTHVLAGDFDGEMAGLSVGHPAALGDDFAGAVGAFILETPTTADVADDYAQGIWWLDPAAGPAASLELPDLPAGWVYEGWVVGGEGPVSTGRFSMSDVADSTGAGATSGLNDAPPFPGRDFIDPPTSLIGFAAVISVEPEPDDSPGPFAIKPLIDMEIEDVDPGVLQMMENNAASAPTGTVTIAGT